MRIRRQLMLLVFLSTIQWVVPQARFLNFVRAHYNTDYRNYLARFNKELSIPERVQSYEEFQKTKLFIEEHNEKHANGFSDYRLGLNHFADMPESDRRMWNGAVLPKRIRGKFASRKTILNRRNQKSIPDTVDYRTSPCLPPIKRQGSCGSSWAFAAMTPIEYNTCMKSNKTTLLSEQQLIDCSGPWNTNRDGCEGGFYTNAWTYSLKAVGLTTRSQYPYTGRSGQACYYSERMARSSVNKWFWLPFKNEDTLKMAVATRGPISAVVNANKSFMFYKSGIFDDPTCRSGAPNHAVVIVGYGTFRDKDYWIIRNSWSQSWGQDGYMFMRRGVNMCGIADFPAFVELV